MISVRDLREYPDTEPLHRSERSLVYRAVIAGAQHAVIVKTAATDIPTFQQIARFKREYAIARRCRHPAVVLPLTLRQQAGRWMMTHEDIGGTSLNRLPGAGRPMPLDDFFDIALQLCAALEVVHGQGIIHKDINPSNIVWSAERRQAQLIDFGIACELARETQRPDDPVALEGTLRYMAPEQTGRMNRSIDYRADYYALGATLYELLTGRPPFLAVDAMELVHCHLAREPDWSLAELDGLPAPLLKVLQRLLAKNAEQRYQSAPGLRADLELCRALTLHPAHTPPDALPEHHARLMIPQRLYGREHETAALLAAFERAAAGPSELLLVAGYSGVGKSAVVHEVHKAIVARRGHVVTGKCDQYGRDVPYAALLQAFRELVRQLLHGREAQLRSWSAKLHAALGANLGVIVELIPELALIVGDSAPPDTLPPVEAQHRLNRVVQRYVQVFCAAAHPLVLFLDDLQWADSSTLRLIDMLMRDPDGRHLLLVGAYRDNEIGPAHPLPALLDQLAAAQVPLATLTLRPLSEAQTGELIADTLQLPAEYCAPLASLCHAKTGGNPFFLGQFLHAIEQAGQLRYRFEQRRWDWDMAPLAAAGYSANVVDLMLDKIRRLPPATQRQLQRAAAIGNRFALQTLAIVGEQTPYQTQQELWPALEAGLVQPLDQRYKYLDADDAAIQIGYRFLHDRVQQAAYAVADQQQRLSTHLSIGRLLHRHATPEQLEQQLFAITEQLNGGRALIADADEKLLLARLNWQAGAKAVRSSAFQPALHHMRTGLSLLPDDAWTAHFALSLDLQLGAAEAAYLCGDFDAADAIYPRVLERCAAPLDQVRCIAVQAHQYQLQGRLLDAIAITRRGLALLGHAIPDSAAELEASIPGLFEQTERIRAGRDADTLLAAADLTDPAHLAAMKMMQALWIASYYAGQQPQCVVMILSMTRLSLEHGNSDFASVGYIGYAVAMSLYSTHDERSHAFGAMAVALADRRRNLQTRTLTYLMFAALINHWTRPLSSCDALNDAAFGWAVDSGDFVQVGIVAAVRATDRLILGHYLPELARLTERDLALMRANGQRDLVDCTIAAAIQPIKCLMGLTARADRYDDDGFSEERFLAEHGGSPLFRAYYLQGKIRNAYLFDAADAEALADQFGVVTTMMRAQSKVPETTFYAALIWLRALRRAPQRADAAALLERVDAARQRLSQWAALGPDNFAAKHALVQAEAARRLGDVALAMRRYQEAIDAARDAGYVNIQALASELYAEFWFEQAQPRMAELFLHDALTHYRRWGADGKAVQLAALHGTASAAAPRHAGRPRPPAASAMAATATATTTAAAAAATGHAGIALGTTSTSSTAGGTGAAYNARLDLGSIIKASQALSTEVGLRKVLRKLIAIVRENSGAQVARLLLLNEDAWSLEAEMAGDDIAVLQARVVELDADADPHFPLSLLRYVARSGAEVIEDDMAHSPRFASDAYVQARQPKSVLCLPIMQANRVGGILYLENNLATASFTSERAEFLRILGGQALASIAHARLHDGLEQRVAERTAQLEEANRRLATLSATDGLTGVANRRHFDEVLEREWGRATRSRQPLAVIMIDVDHFKKYNDCYGHQAGDACLKSVAQVLQQSTRRGGDLVARYGGEEFSIVLPNTDASMAARIAEAMRAAIEALQIPHLPAPLGKITVSVGIAASTVVGGKADHQMRAADAALYRAKNAGRNCVIMTQG